jgi:hypothetical protein
MFAYLRTVPPIVNQVPAFEEGPHPMALPPPEPLRPPGFTMTQESPEPTVAAPGADGTGNPPPAVTGDDAGEAPPAT